MRLKPTGRDLARWGAAALLAASGAAAQAETREVTGELIDTWCYYSGVMGSPESVTGSAHHTCAMWCAAGGIPVGMLGDDGQVYMVLKWADEDDTTGGDSILEIQSDRVTARGEVIDRDGMTYIIVSEVVSNEGLVNTNHEDWGVIPSFAIPEPKE